MPSNTFTLISSVTVGAGGAASIDFTSIPSTYTDLSLVTSMRTTASSVNDDMCMRFNGSSTSYSNKQLYATGSTATSNSPFTDKIYIGSADGDTATASTFGNMQIYIPNYANAVNKSVSTDAVEETNGSTAYMNLVAGLWSNTTAISSISIFSASAGANLKQYSTAYLYGVRSS